MEKGIICLIEGSDAVGKGTLIEGLIKTWKYGEVKALHDPGVHKEHEVGQKLRSIAKEMDLCADAETLLFMACRKELVHEFTTLQENGISSIVDRYKPSTAIYQGILKGREDLIDRMEEAAGFPEPDITIYLNAPFEVLTERLEKRAANIDKFKRNSDFRKKVWETYNAYMAVHADTDNTVHIVNANRSTDKVLASCQDIIDMYMETNNE